MRALVGIFDSFARMAIVVAVVCVSLLSADYLLRNTPHAVEQKLARQNAAAVEVARAIYARNGCSTINGRQSADPSYLSHVDCECRANDSEALADCD